MGTLQFCFNCRNLSLYAKFYYTVLWFLFRKAFLPLWATNSFAEFMHKYLCVLGTPKICERVFWSFHYYYLYYYYFYYYYKYYYYYYYMVWICFVLPNFIFICSHFYV